LLNLPVAQPLPGGLGDRPGRLGERATGRFDRGEPAQPMGVLLCGQVQHGISGVQVGVGAGTVGETFHAHVAKHRRQRPRPPRLDGVAGDLVGVDHIGQPRFPLGAPVQVVLDQLAEQLPACDLRRASSSAWVTPADSGPLSHARIVSKRSRDSSKAVVAASSA
jgi:hypothetical protein